ncbi:hypothetical protein ACFLT7_07020 [candidate division KSB1 bacterium]
MDASSSRERFVALAEKRVTKTIKDLRLVGNLANKSNYTYTEEDTKKILSALEKEFKHLKQRFRQKMGNDIDVFKL